MGVFFVALWVSAVTTAIGYHDLGKARNYTPHVMLCVGAVAAYVAGVNAPEVLK